MTPLYWEAFEVQTLNLAEYGIPQNRYRLFIVGSLATIPLNFFPIPKEKQVVLGEALLNVPKSEGANYSQKKQALFKEIPQGGC